MTTQTVLPKLSSYAEQLNKEDKQYYVAKLVQWSVDCPYCIDDSLWKTDDDVPALIPPVTYFNIYHYLIKQRSSTTEEQFLAYKSLEAEQCVKIGWVSDVKILQLRNKTLLVKGKVVHSQTMAKTLLSVWTLILQGGYVMTGHCTCIAG